MGILKAEVEFLKRMVEIYSPHGREEEISRFLHEGMKALGISSRRDNVGNVIGEVGEGPGILLLCSHMDTVEGELPVRLEDGILYGRGTCDAKASLAAMIFAVSRLVDEDLGGKITLAAVVDEEGASLGMSHLLEEGIDARYAVFGEPSENNRVVIAYKGSISLKITVKGERGHIAASPIRENALEKAIALYQTLKGEVEEEGRSFFYSTNAHLIKIHGGERGLIPSLCEMEVNIRFPPTRSSAEILDRIASSTHGLKGINIQVTGVTEGYESRKDSLIVLAAFRAIMKVKGEVAKLSRKTGTCDMNMLPSGVEGISLGPGDPLLEHTDREAIEVNQFLEAIKIYEQLIRELFTLERNRR